MQSCMPIEEICCVMFFPYVQFNFCNSNNNYVLPGLIVLQQTHHIVTHTSPHRVTSSNIYQIKAHSLGVQNCMMPQSRPRVNFFYSPSTEGTPNTLV